MSGVSNIHSLTT